MKKIEIEVPDYIINLSENELEKLKNTFLRISVKDRVEKLNKEVKKAKNIIDKYEKKYSTNLETIEENGLDLEANIDEHEEYMDWLFWNKVYEKSQKELDKYMLFLGDEDQ